MSRVFILYIASVNTYNVWSELFDIVITSAALLCLVGEVDCPTINYCYENHGWDLTIVFIFTLCVIQQPGSLKIPWGSVPISRVSSLPEGIGSYQRISNGLLVILRSF